MDNGGRMRSLQDRKPLTDATARVNHGPAVVATPRADRTAANGDQVKATELVGSPRVTSNSPAVAADTARLSVATESTGASNRNSAISTASTASGRGKRKTHVGPWQLGRTLGKGATGRVRLAKHAITGQAAAIKIVSKKSAAMVQSESIAAMDKNASLFGANQATRPMPFGIEREIVIMKLIEHPNVINLYDIWENRGELYLVLEYVEGGELFDYVSSHGPLPEEEAVRLFRQIISGLAYCHRFNICHRDLKPENILLDSSHNIKLADFGMAALQPAGHWLNTSCGSPHYAAPEIIYGRRYRGDKADIWSCGIILFALLTGFLPFDGGDLSNTLRLVKKGDYHIPPWLSVEAADLIQRILQKRPEDRISIQSIWNHPLLKKYETLHQAMSQHQLGPPPPLSAQDCGPPVASRSDIDMELLRSLQTLWHSANMETLVERLLSHEPNHEKMFYNALIKFRDEQLENYHGQPLEYSASDYHHISRPAAASRASAKHSKNGRVQGHTRRRSQFSIVTDVSRRSSTTREPMSSGSYDPFRASRPQVTNSNPSAQYMSVIVHRNQDPAGSKENSGTTSNNDAPPSSPPKAGVPPSSSVEIIQWKRTKKSQRSFQSRSSIATSRNGCSPAPTQRPVAGYKRNVSFRHIRNRSGGGSSAKSRNEKPQSQNSIMAIVANNESCKFSVYSGLAPRYSSPTLPAQPAVVRTSSAVAHADSGLGMSKLKDNFWKEETRKVSHELSQICEEAFNRSSVSTGHTAVSTDTTATSMSIHEDVERAKEMINNDIPDKISGSQTSYTVKELTETRRKLIEHSCKAEAAGLPDYLSEIIAHIDRLIEQDLARNKGKPTLSRNDTSTSYQSSTSGSFMKPVAELSYLPSISEEIFTHLDSSSGYDLQRIGHLPTPEPSPRPSPKADRKSTIRVVPHDSSLPSIDEIKPLTIRKRNDPAPPTVNNISRRSSADSAPSNRNVAAGQRTSSDSVAATLRYNSRYPMVLETIAENPAPPRRSDVKAPSGEKKWSWFGRQKSQTHEEAQPSVSKEHILTATKFAPVTTWNKAETSVLPEEDAGTIQKTSGERSRASFLKLFSKKKTEKADNEASTVSISREDDNTLKPFESSDSIASHAPVPYMNRRNRGVSGVNQNWFARFFHVKPATRAVALCVPKARIRKEVYKILREWKQYGMEDVYLDKTENIIYGRVAETNFLNLRPVDFSVEFFTVLEHGRHANLSLVRFRQERGAASSFHKVVDTLEMVLKGRSLTVQDPARSKKMLKVLENVP